MPITHSKAVHVPSPPVPGSNQGADYLPIPLGYQEGSRGLGDQALDVIEAVGCAGMATSSLRP